ncbi:MAG: hypothetical protein ACKPKC_05705 [Dolichospermum sp.]
MRQVPPNVLCISFSFYRIFIKSHNLVFYHFTGNKNIFLDGVVGCRLSVVSCQLLVVSCQLSVVSCQLSVVSCQLSVVSC